MGEFPITGDIGELLLTMEMLILFISAEIGVYFFYKYYLNRRTGNPSFVELDWGIIYISYAMAQISFLYSDFFHVDRDFVLVIGYFILSFGMTFFFYHIEIIKILRTRFIIPLLFSGLIIVEFLIFLIKPPLIKSIVMFLSILVYVILIVYLFALIKRIWHYSKSYSIGLFLGIVLFILGYLGITDAAVAIFGGFTIRVIGDACILGALLSMGFFLGSIPSLAEIGWQDNLKYIIITTNSGVLLYSENFQKKKEIKEILVSGSLYGIQLFLKNLMDQDEVKTISKGKEAILIEKGKSVTGILIADQELEILKHLLQQLVYEFEALYSDILKNWKGDLQLFSPTRHLINNIFSPKRI